MIVLDERAKETLVGSFRPEAALGVTEFDGAEAGPVPTEFVAVTVKVYESPLLSPVTRHDSGPVLHVQLWPPLLGCVESAAVAL